MMKSTGKSWFDDVSDIVKQIPGTTFSLQDVYEYKGVLKIRHPNNNNIEAKIRQQLQLLRDEGIILFLGNGQYTKR